MTVSELIKRLQELDDPYAKVYAYDPNTDCQEPVTGYSYLAGYRVYLETDDLE